MQQEIDLHGDLIDVSELSLHQLDELLEESAVAMALREVLDPARGEITSAGFNSGLVEPHTAAGR